MKRLSTKSGSERSSALHGVKSRCLNGACTTPWRNGKAKACHANELTSVDLADSVPEDAGLSTTLRSWISTESWVPLPTTSSGSTAPRSLPKSLCAASRSPPSPASSAGSWTSGRRSRRAPTPTPAPAPHQRLNASAEKVTSPVGGAGGGQQVDAPGPSRPLPGRAFQVRRGRRRIQGALRPGSVAPARCAARLAECRRARGR
jgi:hypothetical protein